LHARPSPSSQTQTSSSSSSDTIVYSIGAVVVVASLGDPHSQQLLRQHDEEVTALQVSPNGRLVASGQRGSSKQGTANAPVIVWDVDAARCVTVFQGLQHMVTSLAFTPDGRFLAGASPSAMYVWDLATGETVVCHRLQGDERLSTLTFAGDVVANAESRRNPTYTLATTVAHRVFIHQLRYDLHVMRYAVTTREALLPSKGLVRAYCRLSFDSARRARNPAAGTAGGDLDDFLYCGTATGEVVVFLVRAGA
jgi:WD40 repeat protein